MQPVWVIGLMSGTSLDGIDAAAIYTDGIDILEYGPGLTIPYEPEFQRQLQEIPGLPLITPEGQAVEQQLTRLHVQAIEKLREKMDYSPELIGFHGHTVYHAPPTTRQMGDGQLLANLTQLPVVYQFRLNDCAQGGQGAPLIPIYHQALCRDLDKPVCLVNIGGVANITAISDEHLIAFDTGPGNALIDDVVRKQFLQPFDNNGEIAATGHIKHQIVENWLQHPYFQSPYPKSLDRNDFQSFINKTAFKSAADQLATLAAFTSACIAVAVEQLPFVPVMLLVCGGGRKNKFMMHCLQQLLPDLIIQDVDDLYWNGDLLEAQGFAYMAVRKLRELPISFPTTTGVKEPTTGGELIYPENFAGSQAASALQTN